MSALVEKRWYIVTTVPGHENKVKENLEKRIESMDLTDYIFQVVVLEVDTPKLDKDGNPTGDFKKENLYPGYIFVEMIMDDKAWFVVRNTQAVTGLCGSSGKGTKPTPVPKAQMDAILKQAGIVNRDMYDNYKEGTEVKILRGNMAGATGTIKSVDMDKNVVEVSILFLGRQKLVEIEFENIEKL